MWIINAAACAVSYVLAASLCWGQALTSDNSDQKPITTSVVTAADDSARTQPSGKPVIADDASVIVINGLCNNPPKSDGAVSDCKTIITRAEFEKIVAAIQPNMPARAKPEFANEYADALVMAKRAQELGLDKSPGFEEQMKVARVEILVRELKKLVRDEADQVSEKQIGDYYRQNAASFEEADLEWIYVPTIQGPLTAGGASDNEQRKRQSEQVTREFADQLRARALAGEDFTKLQQEAYDRAGIKSPANVTMAKVRRVSLPPGHAMVMQSNPGEVSAVLPLNNGYYIYRLRGKGMLTLEAAHDEIKGILRSQRIQEQTQKVEESATSTLNESYFYPGRRSKVVSQATR
jgi:hypothetical protein